VLSVRLHSMWVTTELLCRCRLRSYKATEEIRKDATSTTKKRLLNESRSEYHFNKGRVGLTSWYEPTCGTYLTYETPFLTQDAHVLWSSFAPEYRSE
jgi:hypothetical protein